MIATVKRAGVYGNRLDAFRIVASVRAPSARVRA
jgi:hypothetical protein